MKIKKIIAVYSLINRNMKEKDLIQTTFIFKYVIRHPVILSKNLKNALMELYKSKHNIKHSLVTYIYSNSQS